jgi:hypothetical protein
VLYSFTGGADGGEPFGKLTRNEQGTLYGTASQAGDLESCAELGCGVVFKITPRSPRSGAVLNQRKRMKWMITEPTIKTAPANNRAATLSRWKWCVIFQTPAKIHSAPTPFRISANQPLNIHIGVSVEMKLKPLASAYCFLIIPPIPLSSKHDFFENAFASRVEDIPSCGFRLWRRREPHWRNRDDLTNALASPQGIPVGQQPTPQNR